MAPIVAVFARAPLNLTLQARTPRTSQATTGAIVHHLEKLPNGEKGQAEKLGVRKGDVLVSVNRKPVDHLSFDATISVIKGEAYPLELNFSRPDAPVAKSLPGKKNSTDDDSAMKAEMSKMQAEHNNYAKRQATEAYQRQLQQHHQQQFQDDFERGQQHLLMQQDFQGPYITPVGYPQQQQQLLQQHNPHQVMMAGPPPPIKKQLGSGPWQPPKTMTAEEWNKTARFCPSHMTQRMHEDCLAGFGRKYAHEVVKKSKGAPFDDGDVGGPCPPALATELRAELARFPAELKELKEQAEALEAMRDDAALALKANEEFYKERSLTLETQRAIFDSRAESLARLLAGGAPTEDVNLRARLVQDQEVVKQCQRAHAREQGDMTKASTTCIAELRKRHDEAQAELEVSIRCYEDGTQNATNLANFLLSLPGP